MNGMFNSSLFRIYRQTDGGGGGGNGTDGEHADDNGGGTQGDTGQQDDVITAEFKEWLEKQPKEAQEAFAKMDKTAQTFFVTNTAGLRKALTSERTLNKDAKTKLTAFEQAEEKRRREAMSELDRTKAEKDDAVKEVTGLKGQLAQIRIESAVLFEAAKLQFVAPEDAIKLIDTTKLKVNEDGTVTGTAAVLAELVKAKPYLVKGVKSPGIGNGGLDKGRQKPAGEEDKRPPVHISL